MKTTIFSLVVLAASVTTVNAQKISAAKVPAAVKTAFTKQYPGTAVKWEMEKSNFEAGFKKDSHNISAIYTSAGILVETETDIKTSELPATVTAYVSANYKGKKISEAAKIVKADGAVHYEAEVDKKDLIFDASGKLIK